MITRLEHIFRKNLFAKIAAIVCAVILWSYVMNEQDPAIENTYTVEIAAVNEPEGYHITQGEKKVQLKVRAQRSLFASLSADDFRAYVDLADAKDGTQQLRIQTVLPKGVELISARPDSIEVTLDKMVTKSIRVEYVTTGAVAQGSAFVGITPKVQYVSVYGPESILTDATRVIGYVGLSGRNDSFSDNVTFTAVGEDGNTLKDVEVTPQNADVRVQITRGLIRKVVGIHVVTAKDLDPSLKLISTIADPEKIEIAGTEDKLAGVSTIETMPISLADVKGDTQLPGKLVLPDGISVTNPNITVKFEVKAKEQNAAAAKPQ